jgi:hypothetical protein
MNYKYCFFGSACIVLGLSLADAHHRYAEFTSHDSGDELREDFAILYRSSQTYSSGSFRFDNPDITSNNLGPNVTGSRNF